MKKGFVSGGDRSSHFHQVNLAKRLVTYTGSVWKKKISVAR